MNTTAKYLATFGPDINVKETTYDDRSISYLCFYIVLAFSVVISLGVMV